MTLPFGSVIGHEPIVDLLKRETSHPAHAYLFTGAEGVGKATVAQEFAALLLCPTAGEHREGECRSCRLALSSSHPDLKIVEPEGAASIGVDQARSVIGDASLIPVESARTVFLIPEAGLLTDQAANALLKTLEEPSSRSCFLLVAESEDDFPSTVASRCRTIHMGRVPRQVLIRSLQGRGVDEDQAGSVADVSGGRPGIALSLMGNPDVAAFRRLWLSLPPKMTGRPGDGQMLASSVLSEMSPLVENAIPGGLTKEKAQRAKRRVEMSLLTSGLEILASWYSDSASLQLGGPIRNGDVSLAEFTEITPRKAVSAVERILDAVIDIQSNMRRELVLTNLFAGLGSDS